MDRCTSLCLLIENNLIGVAVRLLARKELLGIRHSQELAKREAWKYLEQKKRWKRFFFFCSEVQQSSWQSARLSTTQQFRVPVVFCMSEKREFCVKPVPTKCSAYQSENIYNVECYAEHQVIITTTSSRKRSADQWRPGLFLLCVL